MTGQLITRTVDGNVTLGARWTVEDGILTVAGPCGVKSTQLGSSPPECLAMIMLRECYEGHAASLLLKSRAGSRREAGNSRLNWRELAAISTRICRHSINYPPLSTSTGYLHVASSIHNVTV